MLLFYVSVETAPNDFKVYKICELQLSIFNNYYHRCYFYLLSALHKNILNNAKKQQCKILVSDPKQVYEMCWSTTILITYILFGNKNCMFISCKYKLVQFLKGCL